MLHVALPAIACLALTASCAEPPAIVEPAPEPFFRARRQWAVDGKPESLRAADLDGDGRAELIAALQHGALVIWRGTAAGLDREARTLDVGGWPLQPLALPAGSFGAAAGRRLVAVASRAERTLVLLDLTGEAPPRELWRGTGELATPRTIAVGDLGADGTHEIALATDGRVLVLVGEDGSARTLALPHDLPRCSTFAADGSGVWVGFQDSRTLEAVGGRPRTLALAGIPRDVLELDLGGVSGVLVVGGERGAWMFGADGTPFLNWSTGPIPIDVESADLDGNGAPDVAVLTRYGLSYELGLKGAVRGYAGQTPTSLALADFSGDGAVDLAVANRDARAISVVRGDGAGAVLDVTHVPVGVTPTSLTAGLLLGDDELPEVATLNSKDATLSILGNVGGQLTPLGATAIGPSPRAAVIANLAGDDAPDVGWVAQDGSGAWLEASSPSRGPVFGTSGTDLLPLQLFEGGGAELLVTDPNAGLLLGLRALNDPLRDELGIDFLRFEVPSAPLAVCAIELDGDDQPELAVALGPPGPRIGVALLDLVSGEDAFGRPTFEARELAVLETAGWPVDLAALNLDDDGGQDLVVLLLEAPGSMGGFVQPLVRRADGPSFVPGEPLPTGARPHHLAVGDVDGNGLDDVFVDSQNSHVVNGWLTRSGPEGVRLERLDDIGAHLGCLDVALADVNGDGRLDLVVANGFSDDVSVILNLPR